MQNNQTTSDQLIELLLDQKRMKKSLVGGNRASVRSHRRSKRPARLLPLQLLYDRSNKTDNNTDQSTRRFYGPPTNCLELSQLGYTLNDFYLVKTTDANINTPKDGITKLEAISCSFRHQKGAAFRQPHNILENRVGSLKVFGSRSLNGAVHFRVRLESDLKYSNTIVILFGKIVLNMGGGHYDGAKGVFTVPKMGIYYQINFSGMLKSNIAEKKYPIYIQLKINDRISPDFTRIEDNQRLHRVLHETILLNKGDQISVTVDSANGVQYFELNAYATFSCSLLEEVHE